MESASKCSLRIDLRDVRSLVRPEDGFREVLQGSGSAPAPMITQKICGNTKQIAAAGPFAIAQSRRTEETQIAFLQQIVSEGRIAGNMGKIAPHRACGTLVKAGKRLIIHGETTAICRMGGVRVGNRTLPRDGSRLHLKYMPSM